MKVINKLSYIFNLLIISLLCSFEMQAQEPVPAPTDTLTPIIKQLQDRH